MSNTSERLNTLKIRRCKLRQNHRDCQYELRPKVRSACPVLVGHRAYIPCIASSTVVRRRRRNQDIMFCASSLYKTFETMTIVDLNRNISWCLVRVFEIDRCEHRGFPGHSFLFNDRVVCLEQYCSENDRDELILSTYDVIMETWAHNPALGIVPSKRSSFSGNLIADLQSYLVFGGLRIQPHRHCLNDVHLLNIKSNRWIQPFVTGTPPTGRYEHCSFVQDRVCYFYGGADSARRDYNDGIFMLHLATHNNARWSKPKLILDEMPNSLRNYRIIPFKGLLLLCGLRHAGGNGEHALRFYDPKTGRVENLLPVAPNEYQVFQGGFSSLLIDNGKALAVFGDRKCESYTRLSVGRKRRDVFFRASNVLAISKIPSS